MMVQVNRNWTGNELKVGQKCNVNDLQVQGDFWKVTLVFWRKNIIIVLFLTDGEKFGQVLVATSAVIL